MGHQTDRPVLLLSLPRAGSTWTVNVLARSANVRYVSEPADAYRWPAAFWAKLCLAEYPTPYEALASKRFKKLWVNVLDHPSYFNEARMHARILPRIHPSVIRWALKPRQSSSDLSQLKASYKPLDSTPCGERLLIKEVTISFCGGLIADWLGAEVVVLRRDPAKVTASWQKMNFPPEPVHEQPWVAQEVIQPLDINVPPLESHVERLAWTVGLLDLALMREAVARDWPVFTHERLAANPKDEFKKIVRVAGLQPTEEMWRFLNESVNSEGSGYSTSRTAEQLRNSSKAVFSDSDQAKLENVLKILADHLPKFSTNG